MKTIRSLVSTRSMMHRVFLTVAVAFVLIAGLLAMHTIRTGEAHVEFAQSAIGADNDQPAREAVVGSTVVEAGGCTGICAALAKAPDQSVLLTACALTLLAASIVVASPTLLARPTIFAGLGVQGREAAHSLRDPRPPSLFVLSISRT